MKLFFLGMGVMALIVSIGLNVHFMQSPDVAYSKEMRDQMGMLAMELE